MEKIGRNSPCPCGSNLKYKKCCLNRDLATLTAAAEQEQKIYVSREIEKLQERAAARKPTFRLVGAFIFFAAPNGDAWVLELLERDALIVAKNGVKLNVVITETPETIEINWSHRFAIEGGKFVATTYLDNSVEVYHDYPALAIQDTLNKIQRNFSGQLLAELGSTSASD